MLTRFSSLTLALLLVHGAARLAAQEGSILPPAPTPTDVKPGSITCDECPYPYPSKYLDISVYSQEVRIAYMDVAAQGTANGRTVLLLHGNNFGGFYFKPIIDGLTKEGFRVIVPDQIGYGKSSKPIAFKKEGKIPYVCIHHAGMKGEVTVKAAKGKPGK